MNSLASSHPQWCSGSHSPESSTTHTAELGNVYVTAEVGYTLALAQRIDEQHPHLEFVKFSGPDTELTNLEIEAAARLARALALGVRLGTESPAVVDNPIITDVTRALRVLGCVTRTNASALLSLCTVELTPRERAAVLATFAVDGGDR